MVAVMSFVICCGVNRGVQMVFRYPARGVGYDLYASKAELSDDMGTTLGVRTDHLSFLLCPQQISETPKPDVITVEGFSFHVRFFHVQDRMVRHMAIVFAVNVTASPAGVASFTSFLDAYSHALIREQNRTGYLRTAAHHFTKHRDLCEEPKGNWSSLLQSVECSLARELVQITDAVQNGGPVRLYVNGWLHVEAECPVDLGSTTRLVGGGDAAPGETPCCAHVAAAAAAAAGASPAAADASGPRGSGATSSPICEEAARGADAHTYVMVHPDLRLPVDKVYMSQSLDILKDVSLLEYLTLIATPCTVAEFRRRIEKKMADRHAAASASRGLVHSSSARRHQLPATGSSPEMAQTHLLGRSRGGPGAASGAAASAAAAAAEAAHPHDAAVLRQSTFARLLAWLVNRGIVRILRTYYVFQPLVFLSGVQATASRRRAQQQMSLGTGVYKAAGNDTDTRSPTLSLNSTPLSIFASTPGGDEAYVANSSGGVAAAAAAASADRFHAERHDNTWGPQGMKCLALSGDVEPVRSPQGACFRSHVETHVAFLQMVAKTSGARSGGTSVNIIQNLRQVVDYLDGQTPREGILSMVPSVSSEALNEVVLVFNEFITTVIA